jgi:hypothetical protein
MMFARRGLRGRGACTLKPAPPTAPLPLCPPSPLAHDHAPRPSLRRAVCTVATFGRAVTARRAPGGGRPAQAVGAATEARRGVAGGGGERGVSH